ncbi:MAG: hypothetical protein B7Z55_11765, partial [Planctomycetales bacterium 12-60-4]
MEFQYTAKATDGHAATGVIDAASLGEARQRLREQGLFALSLVARQIRTTPSLQLPRVTFGVARVRPTDLLMFTSQLTIMCQAGVDLAEALKNLADQCKHPGLKKTLDAVFDDVSSGQPVSAAMKKHTHVFGDAYVAGIAAGEASGTMNDVLHRLSDLLRNQIRLRSTLMSVLSYPLVLAAVASVVVAALIFFVLPQFSNVFEDMGTPAPPTTRMLMDAANFLRDHLLIMLGAAGLLGIAAWRYWSTDQARHYRDGLLLFCPFVRDATQPLLIGRTLRLIGTMLQSGLPLLDAIQLCRSSIRNRHYVELFRA